MSDLHSWEQQPIRTGADAGSRPQDRESVPLEPADQASCSGDAPQAEADDGPDDHGWRPV